MTLSWLSIVRLGLVQLALGAIVVLTSSTLNRLMVVELALPAVVPGLLVALHYGIQITRPTWGFASDAGGNRTRWIVGGMAALACGGFGAALGVVVIPHAPVAGLVLSVFAYALIGLGVGASGTSLLALLATGTRPDRRAAAATITWMMMIAGIAATAGTVGRLARPLYPRAPAPDRRRRHARCSCDDLARGPRHRAAHDLRRAATRYRDIAPGPSRGLGRAQGAQLHRLRLPVDDRLFHAGADPRALRRPGVRLHPGQIHRAFGHAEWRRVSRDGDRRPGVQRVRLASLRFWVASGCLLSAAALGLVALLGQEAARRCR